MKPRIASIASSTANVKRPRERVGWIALVLGVIAVAAYANSFHAPFVFDDLRTIAWNATLGDFWQLARDGSPAAGRPLVRFTLALNHAIGGTAVEGYHVFNLLVHVAAGLALFGLVRRTLRLPRFHEVFGSEADWLAALAAALWLAHPLQSESVTYVVQRAESLCGCFLLLTLYAFARGAEPTHEELAAPGRTASASFKVSAVVYGSRVARRGWMILSVIACLAGMACKEVMVTAPVLVLLYDRTFLAGSFRGAWRSRWRVHTCLFASGIFLSWLVMESGNRAGSAGFSAGVPWWQYTLAQFPAIVRYVQLALWPEPLIFDYGNDVVARFSDVWLPALIVLTWFGATCFALWRRPVLGFFGAWFFMILAPSSSVVPIITQTLAEHRMYLPLAAIVTGLTLALHAWWGRWSYAVIAVLLVLAVGGTLQRNADYETATRLWGDTVEKAPKNARAHYNLGIALAAEGKAHAALESFANAVAVRPAYPQALDALGSALMAENRIEEAITSLETAVRLQPGFVSARVNLAGALQRAGREDAAFEQYEAALRFEPEAGDVHVSLASLLARRGASEQAIAHYEAALRRRPDWVDARYGLANTLARLQRLAEARAIYETLVRERPADARARTNLGNVHLLLGQWAEATANYEAALRIDPHDEAARSYLEQLRALRSASGGIR